MDSFDTTRSDLSALLETIAQAVSRRTDQDPDILTLPAVARLLRCSEDSLRRIPDDELPIYRVGKANLYLREDVLRFVRSKRVSRDGWRGEIYSQEDDVAGVDRAIQRMIDSSKVDVRKPSKRRVS